MGAILAAVEHSRMAIAVSYRSLEGARVNAINAVDGKGRTALARACHDGNFEEVLQLLSHPHIDIALEDDSGMSPIEWAIKHNHHACASLVRNEAYFRASHRENAFQVHLRAELQCADAVFDERLFRQAVETDPSAAMKYLDQFASSDRYYYHFSQLDAIYGRKNVKSSALYAILNSNILPAQDEAKYVCLQHVVMQRILDIKWELFAERMYYFQLLIFGLMMTAMTMVIASSYAIAVYIEKEQLDEIVDEDSATGITIRLMFHLWSVICIYCLVAKAQLRGLTPEYLYRLARWQHDGVWAPFDRNVTIPSLSLHKSYAKWYLFKRSIVVTLLVATPWCAYIGFGFTGALGIEKLGFMVLATVMSTAGVLLVTALYFLLLEYREILGEDPWIHERRANAGLCGWLFWTFVLIFLLPLATPFMRRYKKYFGSWFNILQLLTYICIVPFALLSILCLVPEFQGLIKDVYLCLGAFITLSLWMLSLQYLEVNKTAGYLLPMLMDALGDVWDFLVFYGVFQCGLTCAFYFIFQQKSDNYKTLWASFRTTYFVLYGDNNVDDFAETDLEGDLWLRPRMFHCAVMVVLLLNLLLAMMNKTVDRNWDKIHARALSSYARCVLRLEMMLGQTEAERDSIIFLTPKWYYSGAVAEHIPINQNASLRLLNPAFTEPISKHDLAGGELPERSTDDENKRLAAQVAELKAQNAALRTAMETSNERVDHKLDKLTALLLGLHEKTE
ncbi:hypothetical protein SPRG_12093 [Saprolegnia parasitica CBS 223.65]|uniref:Polycystin cation channel PKD1/PKD2 domain-containing protein n=1 Tax=Saprolegnia parasitica (strain CBS 223.65) TaxID=695850 RepID=A0A067BZI6_SAPPC|nr:hypothetical protein SPRG_12093 [Saprolegnia parasitica CBS 223.65]KDO22255.1 hypothetical protein SPRG_12093 [Saprolegnia parasitica CBS 223.65]|eukprot:XP_012206991.1 hypothetical protein SPRG_12093 [Saprolegnia parasitica CBS 223.65]